VKKSLGLAITSMPDRQSGFDSLHVDMHAGCIQLFNDDDVLYIILTYYLLTIFHNKFHNTHAKNFRLPYAKHQVSKHC